MSKCENCGEDHEGELIVAASVDTSQLDDLGILSFEFIVGDAMRVIVGVMPGQHDTIAAMSFLEEGFGHLFKEAIRTHKTMMEESIKKSKRAGLN